MIGHRERNALNPLNIAIVPPRGLKISLFGCGGTAYRLTSISRRWTPLKEDLIEGNSTSLDLGLLYPTRIHS